MPDNHTVLPIAWEDALERMFLVRSSPVYMPASIVIALDMVAREEASVDSVPYEEFSRHFVRVMGHVAPNKADRGWQPFFHLAGKSGIWSLQLGGRPASFQDMGAVGSAKDLRALADRAVLASELAECIHDPQVRSAIRDAICHRLQQDDDDEARRLVEWITDSRDLDADGTFEDYAIDNLRREVEQRQKQSTFRKLVLANFDNRCCLSGIEETDLLVASHIVPWSAGRQIRLDPSNGLCLSVLYDKLFDKGYLTFTDELIVVVTPRLGLGDTLRSILDDIGGHTAAKPKQTTINPQYLEYHRTNIFMAE